MPKISVIVPVYNVEKYIKVCINSILAQTYTNLEIILVDDGSPDNCPKILDEYAKKDKRIKVIHKENGGLSSARNAGIDVATGEYIGFVDSDDAILPDMYEKLYNAIKENNAQISICSFLPVDECLKFVESYPGKNPIRNEVLNRKEMMQKLCEEIYYWYYTTAVNKLYQRRIFEEIRFPNNKTHEDEFVSHRIFDMCDIVACLEEPLYLYTQREGSIMHSIFSVKRLDAIIAILDRYELCKHKYQEFALRQLIRVYDKYLNAFKHIPYKKWGKDQKKACGKMVKYLIVEGKIKQAIKALLYKFIYYNKPINKQ